LCNGPKVFAWQSTIAYFNGPAFQPAGGIDGYDNGIDFDGDNTFDFTFSASGIICTTDIPISGCSQSFYISAGRHQCLVMAIQSNTNASTGILIGSATSSNVIWGDPGQGRTP